MPTSNFTDYTDEPRLPFDPDDLTINIYANLTSNQSFRKTDNPQQVPFSRGVKGPATLRGRNIPYKVEI